MPSMTESSVSKVAKLNCRAKAVLPAKASPVITAGNHFCNVCFSFIRFLYLWVMGRCRFGGRQGPVAQSGRMLTQASGQKQRTEPQHRPPPKGLDFINGNRSTTAHASRTVDYDMSLKHMTERVSASYRIIVHCSATAKRSTRLNSSHL